MPTTTSYTVKSGDTLSSIAAHFGLSLADLVAANPQIHDPNLIQVGEQIAIPNSGGNPAPVGGQYDGSHPAPGTTSMDRSHYVHPPLSNTAGNRSPAEYDDLINQFAVAHNPRYTPDAHATYCNIFMWDVTRAMNAEIPHWITANGGIAAPGAPGAREIVINEGVDWLHDHGAEHGWQALSQASAAQARANQGYPTVVVWKNPNPAHHGHTAMVRPGTFDARGVTMAQAGAHNYNSIKFGQIFPAGASAKYYTHD